jgi:hypothetical protein
MRFFTHRVPKLFAACILELIHTWPKLLTTPLLQPLTGVAQVLEGYPRRATRGNEHLPLFMPVLNLPLCQNDAVGLQETQRGP